MAIRNIIFDLGVVLFDLDFSRVEESFKRSGIANFNEIYTYHKQNPLFEEFEKGMLDDKGFCDEIRKITQSNLSDAAIENAWNSLLVDIPKARADFVISLRSKFRVFLLSNTNSMHIKGFEQLLSQQHGPDLFRRMFDKVYFSCELKLRKPDETIFRRVLEENAMKPEETLFIDDVEENTRAASRLGIQTIWLKPGEEAIDTVNHYLKKQS